MTFGTLLYCKSCILKLSDIITTSLLHFERDYALIVFYKCCSENTKWKLDVYIQSIFSTQNSEFRSFYGRIEETIICFRALMDKRGG